VVGLFLMMAFGDEFQHWLYANPGHSIAERRQKWLDLLNEYHPETDRTGYEEAIGKTGWQFYHILSRPFYLIDYAISEILALTIWDRYKVDPADAIAHYKRGCSLSGSRPVPEIYEAFGSNFSFGEAVIEPLARRLADEMNVSINTKSGKQEE
jgi:oligoendopeptidase F